MTSHRPPSTSVEPEEDGTSEDVSSSDEGDDQVELLVTSREKRSTAGTRMSILLEKEGDDELELLFAENEQEEDDEFEEDDADDASDVQLDSASSDEEQGPTKGDDDLEGEKELQKQVRVERQKKRKAQDAFLKPGLLKKRARLEFRPGAPESTATPTTPASRPKKKAERASWLPTSAEGPVRASSRKQTVQNKEIVYSRLVASEKRRTKQLQVMQEAAKRKEASKPKAMTQAQRMEEATRTERLNAKSLSRWETSEKKRSEEQKAKLEALHNRQLTGPVISWWSGMARWVNGKLEQVGWKSIKEAEAKSTPQVQQQPVQPKGETPSESQKQSTIDYDTVMNEESSPQPQSPRNAPSQSIQTENPPAAQQIPNTPPQGPQGFLDGIHYYASLPEQPPSHIVHDQSGVPIDHQTFPPEPREIVSPTPVEHEPSFTVIPSNDSPSSVPRIEYSGRTVVILEDIDANAQQLPELQNHVLLKKRKLTQVDKQSRFSSHDRFPQSQLISAKRMLQKRYASSVRSPSKQLDIETRRRAYHMQIRMHIRRYGSWPTEGLAGVVY